MAKSRPSCARICARTDPAAGKHREELLFPGVERRRAERVHAIAAEAPEEAHQRDGVRRVGTEAGRQHPRQHTGAVHDLPQLALEQTPVVFADEPERAPWIGLHRPAEEPGGVVPQLRSGPVRHDDEVERAWPSALAIDHVVAITPGVREGRGLHAQSQDHGGCLDGPEEAREERAAVHAVSDDVGTHRRVVQPRDQPAAPRLDVERVHRRPPGDDLLAEAEGLEHHLAGRLEHDARAHGPGLREALEEGHAMTRARQEEGRRRSGGPATDDRDVQRAHRAPGSVHGRESALLRTVGSGDHGAAVRALPTLIALFLAGCGGCGHSSPTQTDPAPLASTAAGEVRIIVGGDSRDDSAHVVPWAFEQARARHAAAFLFLGDMELTPELDRAFARELALLDPVPLFPVLGNHEVEQIGMLPVGRAAAEASLARRFLGTPRTPVHSSLPGRLVYSTDLPGGVHFIALDNVSQRGFGPEQLAWLKADLARARADGGAAHILVGMHKPLAHNGVSRHGMDHDGPEAVADSEAALAAMVDGHVEMILASHVHEFAQLEQGGIRTYVTGGLGAPLVRSGPDHAVSITSFQPDIAPTGIRVEVSPLPGHPVRGPRG